MQWVVMKIRQGRCRHVVCLAAGVLLLNHSQKRLLEGQLVHLRHSMLGMARRWRELLLHQRLVGVLLTIKMICPLR